MMKTHQVLLRTVMSVGAVAGVLALTPVAQAEGEVAYCDTADYAIKIYRRTDIDPEAPEANQLFMRIYYREDNISFINNTPVSQEAATLNEVPGTNYTNLMGENEWRLFMPDNPGGGLDPEAPGAEDYRCVLFRDGEQFDMGQGRRM